MMFNDIIQFIFPSHCVMCDTLLPFGDKLENLFLCRECRNKIELIKEPTCKKCGAMIDDMNEMYCTRCQSVFHEHFDFGFGLCRYNDYVKESIHRIKYEGRKEYIGFYAKMIAKLHNKKLRSLGIDCFVAVPIHKSRLNERTYNQSLVLAKELSEELKEYDINIPVKEDLIFRQKKTKVLNKLDENERKNELNDAFSVNPDVDIEKVLIVDDIYTTGSTIDAMSKCLKEDGVKNVYFVTIAIVDNL